MIHEDFVTFDQAMKLKDLGFNWKCNHYYRIKEGQNLGLTSIYDTHNTSEKGISAPTLAQAQKWLREVKNIVVLATCNLDYEKGHEWYWFVDKDFDIKDPEHAYKTYEEALETGINKALELLK